MRRRATKREMKERCRRVKKLHDEGYNQREAGAIVGRSDQTVRRDLRKAGVAPKPGSRPRYKRRDVEYVADLYEAGLSMRGIENLTPFDGQTVRRMLASASVKMRPESVRPTYSSALKQRAITMYVEEKISARDVADRLDLKSFTVKDWLTRAGVMRTMSEAAIIRCSRW